MELLWYDIRTLDTDTMAHTVGMMDEERRRYRHADLLISGKEIKAIGKNLKDTLGDTVTIDEVVDASGRVILPGFVNTHHHTWQTLIRNIKATQGLRLDALPPLRSGQ